MRRKRNDLTRRAAIAGHPNAGDPNGRRQALRFGFSQ
jgi:hypothetical protein